MRNKQTSKLLVVLLLLAAAVFAATDREAQLSETETSAAADATQS